MKKSEEAKMNAKNVVNEEEKSWEEQLKEHDMTSLSFERNRAYFEAAITLLHVSDTLSDVQTLIEYPDDDDNSLYSKFDAELLEIAKRDLETICSGCYAMVDVFMKFHMFDQSPTLKWHYNIDMRDYRTGNKELVFPWEKEAEGREYHDILRMPQLKQMFAQMAEEAAKNFKVPKQEDSNE